MMCFEVKSEFVGAKLKFESVKDLNVENHYAIPVMSAMVLS